MLEKMSLVDGYKHSFAGKCWGQSVTSGVSLTMLGEHGVDNDAKCREQIVWAEYHEKSVVGRG